jgi:hypothetical protein
MDKRRLVEVYGLLDGSYACGSGYLVGRGLVLTCAHGVPPVGPQANDVELRILGHPVFTKVDGRVIWHRYDGTDSGVDAALVEITTPGWFPADGFAAIRWGELEDDEPVDVLILGFPASVDLPDQRRDTDQVEGRLKPLAYLKSGRYAIDARHNPNSSADADSNWSGVSGGPVFLAGLLVGLVVAVPKVFGDRRLIAVPSRAVLDDGDAAAILRQHGVPLLSLPWSTRRRIDFAAFSTEPELLDADAIPRLWKPDEEPALVRCTERYRLDALVGTTVGAFTIVLASNRPLSITDTLEGLRRTTAAPAGKPLRTWFQLRGEDAGALRNRESLLDQLTSPAGWDAALRDGSSERVGIVVPVEVDLRGLDIQRRQVVQHTLQVLRNLLPSAGLLVNVKAGLLLDAMRGARMLASFLDVDRTLPGCLALRSASPSVPRFEGRLVSDEALATLTAGVRDAIEDRGLHWAVPAVPGTAGRGLPVPDDIVTELNLRELPPWEECSLLRQVRALLPSLWPELLHAHRRARSSPGCYSSLAVAAERPEDLDVWLTAGGGRVSWPDPLDVPTELMERNLTEAVLIEMLARGAPYAEFDRWVTNGVGQPGRVLRATVDRGEQGFEFDFTNLGRIDQESAGLIAQAAVRCGYSIADLPQESAKHCLYWAMLVRGGMTPEVLDAVAHQPDHLLAVLCGEPASDDVEMADTTSRLRQQIPHLTTKE